jgi:hypothetical protein
MPQLVKGGKYVFGWSKVEPEGRIAIPPEAFNEYGFRSGQRVILMAGSKTSGGFSVTDQEKLNASPLSRILKENPRLTCYKIHRGTAVSATGRIVCWEHLAQDDLRISLQTLEKFGIEPEDYLLAVRGSHLGLGFLARGPIFEEAKKHPEIEIFS